MSMEWMQKVVKVQPYSDSWRIHTNKRRFEYDGKADKKI